MGERRPLWVPNKEMVLPEYPVPTQTELCASWVKYLGEAETVIAAPGVYGALRIPQQPPRAFASIDLCEVVRETNLSLRRTVRKLESEPLRDVHKYYDGLSFSSLQDITSVLQVLMNADLVLPVAGIDDIAAILKTWRAKGIYTFANTSTLPGCEPGTVRFLSKHLSGGLDGILFPRNHHGEDPLTKGVAARNVIQQLASPEDSLIALHIDDTTHHNTSFRAALGSLPKSQVRTFLPEYPSSQQSDPDSVITPTPLAAFQAADAFFRSQLV